MAYNAPGIGSLSAHEYNKIRQSYDAYRQTQGRYSNSPMYDPNHRGARTQFEMAKARASAPRKEFQRGSYGIEDEYRYMVSQGYRPQAAAAAAPPTTAVAPRTFTPPTSSGPTNLPTGPDPTINQPQYDPTAMFAQRMAEMQEGMMQALQMQQQQFQQAQQQQNERMEQMMAATMQAQAAAAARPEVASVKMADSSQGNQMTIAKRGVKGNFNRKGMRIKNINTEQ